MPLYAIPNLASNKAFPVNPWEFKPEVPPNALKSKEALIRWGQNVNTEHCFFSGFEGLDPFQRVRTKDNPGIVQHALPVDFDAKVTEAMKSDVHENCPTEFKPNWLSSTFSGGARAVFQYEEPLYFVDTDHYRAFVDVVMKKLGLRKLFPGLDDEALRDPSRYYECGSDWVAVSDEPIPTNFLHQWMYDAGNKVKWGKKGDGVHIPLQDVHEEIQKQYPRKWTGPFELGTRGDIFWDPMGSKNKTAAVVRESGMQCFSGDTPFYSWGSILGSKFVRKYEANRTGGIISNTFYDGKYYWRKDASGMWVPMPKEDLRLMLRVKHGLSKAVGKGETFSPVDKVEFAVQEMKSVVAAAPFIYRPTGIFTKHGRRYLNIATVRAMTPADNSPEWGIGFPFMAEFLDGFFDPEEQLEYFLSWLKHDYDHALDLDPVNGHALFLAGQTGTGKTFLFTAIVSRLLGGHVDGSRFMLNDEKFTDHIFEEPLILMDDCSPAHDQRLRTKFSNNVKRLVANSEFLFEKKFHGASMVDWMGGRFATLLNEDPESIRMLPDMEISIRDKVMLLRGSRRKFEFPATSVLTALVRQELPHFAAWLHRTYEIPEHIRGDSRFGVKEYHEPHLLKASLQEGTSYSFLELLFDFLRGWADTHKDEATHWIGNATTLVAAMNNDESIAALARQYSPVQVARLLGQLKSRGFPVERERKTQHRVWIIPFDLEEYEEQI